jgi:hypothetical protein
MKTFDTIAERTLEAKKDKTIGVATVRLGRPIKSADAPDYRCPYQVLGVGDDSIRSASGEDSMQAIQLALQMISAELFFRHQDYEFSWLNQPDAGFTPPKVST